MLPPRASPSRRLDRDHRSMYPFPGPYRSPQHAKVATTDGGDPSLGSDVMPRVPGVRLFSPTGTSDPCRRTKVLRSAACRYVSTCAVMLLRRSLEAATPASRSMTRARVSRRVLGGGQGGVPGVPQSGGGLLGTVITRQPFVSESSSWQTSRSSRRTPCNNDPKMTTTS
jgi:hypothetical protein